MKSKHLLLISITTLPILLGCKPKNELDAINKLLTANKDNIHTCYDAVYTEGVKEKLQKSIGDNKEYVYDSKSKQFVIMSGDKIIQTTNGYTANNSTLDYFKFVKTYNPNSKYSQYLLNDNPVPSEMYITTGFDCGIRDDIERIVYTNYSTIDNNVIIRAYSDYLTIEAPYQTVTHYSDTTNIIANDVKQLNTCGICSYLKMKNGTINFDNSGSTRMFEIEENHEADVYIKSTKESDVYALVNCKQSENPTEHECRVGMELIEAKIRSTSDFKNACEKNGSTLLRLESDVIFEKSSESDEDLDSITINHALCIDLNGFKLSMSDFKVATSTSYIREAIRIQSVSGEDRSVYLIDSTGVDDGHAGIFLNNCSIVVSGVYDETKEISTNFVMNSGKIVQTITGGDNVEDIGGAITLLGNTIGGQKYPRYATLQMRGGSITCNNESATNDKFGCIGACGLGAIVDLFYGKLISNEFCIFGSINKYFDLSNATISVIGSTLQSSRNTCIYFPLISAISLEGATITGATCVNVSSGTLTISDCAMTSNGTGALYSSKNYDGSVIYVPKAKLLDKGDLTIDVVDSTLISKFEYILNVTTGVETSNINVTFGEGNYTYKRGAGYVISPSTTIVNKKGTWTKKEY